MELVFLIYKICETIVISDLFEHIFISFVLKFVYLKYFTTADLSVITTNCLSWRHSHSKLYLYAKTVKRCWDYVGCMSSQENFEIQTSSTVANASKFNGYGELVDTISVFKF